MYKVLNTVYYVYSVNSLTNKINFHNLTVAYLKSGYSNKDKAVIMPNINMIELVILDHFNKIMNLEV